MVLGRQLGQWSPALAGGLSLSRVTRQSLKGLMLIIPALGKRLGLAGQLVQSNLWTLGPEGQ